MTGWPVVVFGTALTFVAEPSLSLPDAYESLVYDHEVAAECGLLQPPVRAAFRRARDDIAARSNLDTETLKRRRLKAIVRAMREYDNRGLGGYKAWCAGEGADGVRRILSADPDGQ